MRKQLTPERLAHIREVSAKLIADGYKPYEFYPRFQLSYSAVIQIISGKYEKDLANRKEYNRKRRADGKEVL